MAADDGLFSGVAGVHEVPLAVLFAEEAQFAMPLRTLVGFKCGGKGHCAHFIIGSTLFGFMNLQPGPFGGLRPFSVGVHVDVASCLGIMGLLNKRHFHLRISGISRAHQLFSRHCDLLALNDGLTACGKRFSTLTRTLHRRLLAEVV